MTATTYLVGGKFVNIREEDSELLHKHILNKRKQQLIVNGLLFALILFFFASARDGV